MNVVFYSVLKFDKSCKHCFNRYRWLLTLHVFRTCNPQFSQYGMREQPVEGPSKTAEKTNKTTAKHKRICVLRCNPRIFGSFRISEDVVKLYPLRKASGHPWMRHVLLTTSKTTI